MQKRYPEIRALGGEVLAVVSAQPAALVAYLARDPVPFSVVTDPSRESYRALGLGRTSWGSLLRGGVLGRYLHTMLHGWMPGRPGEGEDVLQLGGDFVLDCGSRLVYAYRSAEPTDRPDVEELLSAIRAAGGR